jgi:anti-anti-sigma factor
MHEPLVTIDRTDLTGLTWITLDGELDLAASDEVLTELTLACDACTHPMVVDTRRLRFIDLAGLRMLLALERRQRARGAHLSFVPGPVVRRLARLVGMGVPEEADPGALLGLATATDADPPHAGEALRARVAGGCARQQVLLAQMVALTTRARSTLETVRGTSRLVLESRTRRADLT